MNNKFPPHSDSFKPDLGPIDIPLKVNPDVDVGKLIEALAKTVQYKCPNCGTELIYDYETENYEVFYCPKCRKRAKAKKGKIENERSYFEVEL